MSVLDIHPKDEIPRLTQILQAIVHEGYRSDVDIPILRKDGSISHVNVIGNPLVYRGRQCIAAFFRDIAKRKRAQEALRQSEEKYRGLLEACPDAVIMTDLKGKILFASQRTWELVNLSDQDELVGKNVFDFVMEGKPGQLAASYSNLVATGVRRNTEYAIRRQNGTTVPTEVSSAVSRDTKGQPIAVMGVIRDITERKRAEKLLQKENIAPSNICCNRATMNGN